MQRLSSLKKLGAFAFALVIFLSAAAMFALVITPPEARVFRRVVLIIAYVCGLPAGLGLAAIVFEKLGWLKGSEDEKR